MPIGADSPVRELLAFFRSSGPPWAKSHPKLGDNAHPALNYTVANLNIPVREGVRVGQETRVCSKAHSDRSRIKPMASWRLVLTHSTKLRPYHALLGGWPGLRVITLLHQLVQGEGHFVWMRCTPCDDPLELDDIVGNGTDLH